MNCQRHYCDQGRQPCPTPYTCRHACTTLDTPQGSKPVESSASEPMESIQNQYGSIGGAVLLWALICILVAVFAGLVGYLSVKLS